MSTHNIYFYGELTKMILQLSSKTLLICSTEIWVYNVCPDMCVHKLRIITVVVRPTENSTVITLTSFNTTLYDAIIKTASLSLDTDMFIYINKL